MVIFGTLNFSAGKAEIVSIHCVNQSKEFNDLVLGLTYELVCIL